MRKDIDMNCDTKHTRLKKRQDYSLKYKIFCDTF